MFIPDVINTLLMGLIFMVVIVTIVRPFVLNMVGQAASNSDMQKAAVEAVEREMMRKAELFEAQRADKIKYQMLLLEVPQKPIPKAVLEPEPEVVPEVVPEPVAEVQPEVVETPAPEETVEAPPVEETAEHAAEATDETAAEETADESEEEALGEGEIEIREGETLAEIKERIRKEQQKAKKPTIPPELLNTANSYEDKVGVVRMVVQTDQTRVASVIRGMIQVNK
ncbi:MAG: Flagellar M-ring protein [Pseudomonadota bacterium]|jgi:outer membrane biosynthesis protein TonB